jgi:hypothetical protein
MLIVRFGSTEREPMLSNWLRFIDGDVERGAGSAE